MMTVCLLRLMFFLFAIASFVGRTAQGISNSSRLSLLPSTTTSSVPQPNSRVITLPTRRWETARRSGEDIHCLSTCPLFDEPLPSTPFGVYRSNKAPPEKFGPLGNSYLYASDMSSGSNDDAPWEAVTPLD